MTGDDRPIDVTLAAPDLGAQVLTAALARPDRAVGLRNTLFLPLLRQPDPDRAAAVNAALIQAAPANLLFQMDAASLALKRQDLAAADRAATALRALGPDDPAAAAQAIQVWLVLGDVAKAAQAARDTAALWSGQARLAQMAMTALYRAGEMRAAVEAARQAVAASPDDLALAAAAAGVFLTSAQASAATAALERAGAETSGNARALFELGRARAMLNPRDLRARDALQASDRIEPGNPRTLDLLARVLATRGQHDAACDLLLTIPEDQRSEAMTLQLARALSRTSRQDQALQLYAGMVARDPGNLTLRRHYAGALARAGRQEAAVAAYAVGLTQRARPLPASFAQGVDQILADPPDAGIPPARLQWMYQVLTRAGRAPADRAAWEAGVARGNRIDQLMLDWLECRPDQAEEIVPFLGDLSPGATVLHQVLAEGRGAFLTTAHVGMLLAGPPALQTAGIKSVWLSSVPNLQNHPHFDGLISTSGENQRSIGLAVLRALRQGQVVGVAIDGLSVPGDLTYPLFDKEVQLSDFVPRLAHRRAVPSFFPRLRWGERTLVSDVVRLPDPAPGESEDDFAQRWMRAFLAEVEAFLLEFPTSLRASGGFWGSIAF